MRIKFDSDNRCVIIDRKEFYTLYSIPDHLSIDIDSKTWINIVLFFSKLYYPDE